MSNVGEIIASEIAGRGKISFARFMDLALYCPIYGYYEKQEDTIGRRGDFYTSVSVGSLFGELLAWQFADWLVQLRLPHPRGNADARSAIMQPAAREAGIIARSRPDGGRLQVVEAGAHDGRLAADILTWLRAHRPALFDQLEYWIIEPSPRRQGLQARTLGAFAGRVQWAPDFAGWKRSPRCGINGIVFSNELLDSFPVHRLGWDARQQAWFEWGVTIRDGAFVWTRLEPGHREHPIGPLGVPAGESPAPNAVASERFNAPPELIEALPDGFTIEFCPAAELWWRDAAQALNSGKLLTLDYGLTAEERFEPRRKDGTLLAFHNHHSIANVLASPGQQDLTSHVNFSELQAAGEGVGLETESFSTQEQFLNRIAARISQADSAFGEWSAAKTRQFQTLTHPEHLGRAFRVLVQSRTS